MDYELIKGIRGELVYVPSEKTLYAIKNRRNGELQCVCYQTILASRGDQSYCTGNIKICRDGKCVKMNVSHIHHSNHEAIFQDLERRNSMIEKCRNLKENHDEDAHRISARNIFQREIAKYDLL